MTRVTPFQTGFELDDTDLSPGAIFRKLDGTLWEVQPDGSQVALGGDGSLPAQWTVDAFGGLSIATTPTGDDSTVTFVSREPAAADSFEHFTAFRADGFRWIEFAKNYATWHLASSEIGEFVFSISAAAGIYGSNALWGVEVGGYEWAAGAPAPNTDDVPTSQRWQRYDDASGAPKQRIYQRDIDGTLFERISAVLTSDASAFAGVSKPTVGTADAASILAALVTLGLVIDGT